MPAKLLLRRAMRQRQEHALVRAEQLRPGDGRLFQGVRGAHPHDGIGIVERADQLGGQPRLTANEAKHLWHAADGAAVATG